LHKHNYRKLLPLDQVTESFTFFSTGIRIRFYSFWYSRSTTKSFISWIQQFYYKGSLHSRNWFGPWKKKKKI